ncbi:MAG TPA: alpha-amylase family glycosyl hydrolase [Acidobacteriaceae bacterium]|jgi:glycosidase|nr:alpha-amylase family glycosyl hydrolase [Acidobacteriaceae bacterium]
MTPCVDKVDPPNWWTALPSPMLLLHGAHLEGAKFSISGDGLSITKSQISSNGHYAFVWLETRAAAPQQSTIRVTTAAGSTTVPFRLERRASAAHAGFSPADVMYLIMTDRFADGDLSNDPTVSERSEPRGWHGGDFRGVQQHLAYLDQLGVTTLWLTPVYDNGGGTQAYHGYSATDLYRPDPHFGTLADLQQLSDALHRRGMKLVLDTVPNHVGAANPWAADPPTPDWFHGTRADHRIASDQFQWVTDPHATWEEQRDVTEGWFANVLPDLNQENPLVRQYLIQNVIWWIEETGADGLRYDTFPYVGRAFWQSLDSELQVLYPRLTTVGEVFNANPVLTSYFAGGVKRDGIDTGLTTPFDFPTYFALRAALAHHDPVAGGPVQHDDLTGLETVLREDWLYPHPERLVTFIGNHDTVRFLSQPGIGVPELKIAFALLATMRGMPQIYSGDEIAMRGGADPDNRHDFPGGFPGDTQDAFTAAGRTPEQASVHDWVAALFRFRRQHPVLATGQQQDVFVDPSAFVYVRTPDMNRGCGAGSGEHDVVAVNDGDEARDVQLDLDRTALAGCTVFTGQIGSSAVFHATGAHVTLSLPAKQAVVFLAQ